MKCPHCLQNFFEDWSEQFRGVDADGSWRISSCLCPSCKKYILKLEKYFQSSSNTGNWLEYKLIRPKGISRSPLSEEVPEQYAIDYKEACLVMSDSPKASSALSRRCLQLLLRDKVGVTQKDLSQQINDVLSQNILPSYLSESLDAVRNIGNFAAHPLKHQSSGEIVDVEPGEAEWNLDVLEGLFDFFFVQPNIIKQKRDKLNQKLNDLGKPEMK